MRLLPILVICATSALLLSSCVSSRKYDEMESWKNRLQRDYDQTSGQAKTLTSENTTLRKSLDESERERKNCQNDLALSKDRYEQLDATNRDLLMRYDRMLAQNRELLESSSGEIKELTAKLSAKELELEKREQALKQAEADAKAKEGRANQLESSLSDREKRVKELESALQEKESKLNDIRDKVNQALRGFSAADLSVREQDGKIYVSLSQNLLFRSGSRTINAEGKNAIAKLAQVLSANADIAVMVEGHTDSDGESDLNWDLSVMRATSVVRELTTNGLDPKRIIASGRGEFYPVATNETANGKAQNRRTEIILTPNLQALFEIIGK
ncbi:MAG: OmpA family protein [Saprospiraceae bacterium]|nr:OmpA family protein [Saprospiraceae bacterium]